LGFHEKKISIEGIMVKLPKWLSTTMLTFSRIKTHMIECYAKGLETYSQEILFFLWKLLNQSSYEEVGSPQNNKIHNLVVLILSLGSPQNFWSFQCSFHHHLQINYIGRRMITSPKFKPWCVVLWMWVSIGSFVHHFGSNLH
jgi:hypothetical protein